MDEFPLGLALDAVELVRSTWYYQAGRVSYAEKYARLKGPLLSIAKSHSEYGYRRATIELREVLEETINRKVVQRLHGL